MVTELVRLTVRCDEFAPTVVREAVSKISGLGWLVGDAMLVANELVSNAVRHSACRDDEFVDVALRRDGWLRISVVDPGGSGEPAEPAAREVALGGVGLRVVEQIAARWGTERRPDGYEVWA